MTFWQYIFSFLYARHPDTGERFLSKERLYVFLSGVALVAIALGSILVLQAPIEYTNQNQP